MIRPICPEDYEAVFPLLAQLRTDLDFEEFQRRFHLQKLVGYRLFGLELEGAMVGLVGFRMVHNFARGFFVEIDDLVVDLAYRGRGWGERLVDFAAGYGQDRGATAVYLHAPEPESFYERLGFVGEDVPVLRLPVAVRAPAGLVSGSRV